MNSNSLLHRFYLRLTPPRVRFALCVMVGAYPLITALLAGLAPLTVGWPLAARTLLVVPLMVTGMTFVISPAVHRIAGRWIAAGLPGAERT